MCRITASWIPSWHTLSSRRQPQKLFFVSKVFFNIVPWSVLQIVGLLVEVFMSYPSLDMMSVKWKTASLWGHCRWCKFNGRDIKSRKLNWVFLSYLKETLSMTPLLVDSVPTWLFWKGDLHWCITPLAEGPWPFVPTSTGTLPFFLTQHMWAVVLQCLSRGLAAVMVYELVDMHCCNLLCQCCRVS